MPLYDIRCDECQEEFEEQMTLATMAAFKDGSHNLTCENCGSGTLSLKASCTRTKHVSWSLHNITK